jgi:hypothetical protein
MDFGQGIANAGNLFGQSLLAKQEREDRLKREALAQQNQQAEQDWRMSQLDRQNANDLYNQSLRTAQFIPEGAELTPETAQKFDPRIRESYFEHLPQGLGGVINMDGSPVPQKPERYVARPMYRKEEAVAQIRGDASRDVATTRAGASNYATDRRYETARERLQQTKAYQDAMVAVQQDRTGIARGALAEAIRNHDMINERGYITNDLDNEAVFQREYFKALQKNPNAKPIGAAPSSGRGKKPGAGTAPTSYDAAMSNFAGSTGLK